MQTQRQKESFFGVTIYDRNVLVFNQTERKRLEKCLATIREARERIPEDTYLDTELGSIECRLADLLDLHTIEII